MWRGALIARLSGAGVRGTADLRRALGFHLSQEGGAARICAGRRSGGEGGLEARKHPREGAGILTSLTESDGLVELPEAVTTVKPGDEVGFLPYAVLR